MKNILVLTVLALLCICVPGVALSADMEILGAGATFPNPLYSKMFDSYYQQYKVKVNYQGIGSGGGIKQLISKTVDFGGTDAFMTAQEMKEAGAPVVHIPACLGAVVLTYNLPNNPKLRFTADIVADIFLGKIKKWNDPRIASVNQDISLPDLAVSVAHRSDGSGTTYIFSDYLSTVSKEWKEKVGTGKALNWPTGLGAKGNPGVAGLVKQVPGSVGYVELIYALQNNMSVGALKNKAGKFIDPSLKSTSAAANTKIPDNTDISLVDTDAPEGYSIAGFTWIMLYKEQNYGGKTRERAEALAKLMKWTITEGQKFVEPLHYSALSKDAAAKADKIVRSITYGGQPLVK
jgi:phosphate transport system substrate-binding protein